MAEIQWTSDLDTGIPVIDKQHRRIVEYINQLDHARTHHSRDEVSNVLDQLVDYTLSHFAFEESLMEDAEYPFVNAHKRVHALFVKRIADYQQRFKVGEEIDAELQVSLTTWLLNHIKNDDNDYAADVRRSLGGEESKGNWGARSLKKFFG
ncbi:MAG: bacteriohemerythrin [Acidihalobacter sp.]